MNAILNIAQAQLTIAGVTIRQDSEGRYCLNDLHRASGGEKRHGPSYWLTNAQTRALIDELATTGIPVVTLEGAGGGTYVAKELVYAYAMWISAAFHLKVIRAYDAAVVTQPPAFVVPQTMAQALRLAADQFEQIEVQREALALAAPKVEFVEKYVQASTGSKGFRQVCKLLNVKEPVFRQFLKDKGVMYFLGGEWVPHAQHIDAGRFETKAGVAEHGDTSHAYNQAMFTAKGVGWIAGEWAKHQVAMNTAKEGVTC